MIRPDDFNGPNYEPDSLDLPEGLSYCVGCGGIMVYHWDRDCPACSLAKVNEELRGDNRRLRNEVADLASRLGDLERRLEHHEEGGA